MFKTITGAAAALTLVCLAAPAQASPNPPGHGCPAGGGGFVLWDVSTEPYAVDNLVDEQGNNDGWACASPRKVVLDDNGEPFQIYNFIDNRVVTH
jgi:hypothetical protein